MQRFAVLWNEIEPTWVDSVATWEQQLGRPGDAWTVFHTPLGRLPQSAGDFDGIVVTGSHHSVNDPEQHWARDVEALIRSAHDSRTRLVGSCFGAQIIATALGGRVGPNPSGEYVLGAERIMPVGTSAAPGAVRLHQSHGECVVELPPGAVRLATSASCDNEVFQVGDDILAIQAHPELSRAELRDRILAARLSDGRIKPFQATRVLRTLADETDGSAVMAGISRFLRREQPAWPGR